MVTDNLASLCEQELVDCVTVDSACNGEVHFRRENATCSEASHSFATRKGARKVSDCTIDRPGKCHEIQSCAHRQ